MLAELEARTSAGVKDAGAPDWINQLAQAAQDLQSQVLYIGQQMKRAAQWAEIAEANLIRRIKNGKVEAWKNFQTYLTGDARKGFGKRMASIGTDQQTFKLNINRTIIQSFGEMTDSEISRLWKNPEFQDKVVREMFPFSTTGAKHGDDLAYQVARAMMANKLVTIKRGQNVGAATTFRFDHITNQFHNVFKMKEMQADEWIKTIKPMLNHARTFKGGDPDKVLRSIYKEITETPHMDGEVFRLPKMSDRVAYKRELHFKNADSWIDYSKMMGSKNVLDDIVVGLHKHADRVVLMEHLGPDPDKLFNKTLKKLKREENISPFDEDGIRARYAQISGQAFLVADPSVAKWVSALSSFQILTSLGKAMISSFGDTISSGIVLHSYGKGFLESYRDLFVKGVFQRLSPAERQMVARYLNVGFDGLIGQTTSRMTTIDPVPGMMSELANQFFTLNGLNWWTDMMRESFSKISSHHLAKSLAKSWDDLPKRQREIFEMYFIGKKDWELFQKAGPLKNADLAEEYFTPHWVRTVADRSEIIPKSQRSAALEAAHKLERFFTSEARIAVPEAGAGDRAVMMRNFRRGTLPGSVAQLFFQFRTISVVMATKIYPRMLQMGAPSLLHLIPAAGIGYMTLATKDILSGKSPRDLDGGAIKESWIQSGLFGFAGDIFLEDFDRYHGRFDETLLGPTWSTIKDSKDLMEYMVNSDEGDAQKAWSTLNANTPYVNLFYLQGAWNYMINWPIQDSLNPGYLDRAARYMEEERGQGFLFY